MSKESLLAKIAPKTNNSIRSLKAALLAREKEIERLITPPLSFGVVITTDQGMATLCSDGKVIEVLIPAKMKLAPGETVRLAGDTNQILAKSQWQSPGEVCSVKRVVDNTFVEIEYQGYTQLVYRGSHKDIDKGDRVVVDSSLSIIVKSLGKLNDDYAVTQEVDITWDDIGGCDTAKAEMIDAIESPHLHQDLYKHYGKKPIKGILLWGPPGCGKTLLAQAAANAQAKLHGQKTATGFFSVKGPELLSRFVGDAEAAIRNLFQQGREHQQAEGYPALIFIDEAEALLSKRGSGISSDVERTIVPAFLTEMDGFVGSGSIVILATNRPDVLDPAVIRSGRIDRKIQITRPTKTSATSIFLISLKKLPIQKGQRRKKLAEAAADILFSNQHPLYKIVIDDGKVPRAMTMGLQHICNGAMLASIINRAASHAMSRDIEQGTHTGLALEDIEAAFIEEYEENIPLEHQLALEEFTRDFADQVINIKKVQVR